MIDTTEMEKHIYKTVLEAEAKTIRAAGIEQPELIGQDELDLMVNIYHYLIGRVKQIDDGLW